MKDILKGTLSVIAIVLLFYIVFTGVKTIQNGVEGTIKKCTKYSEKTGKCLIYRLKLNNIYYYEVKKDK